MDVKCCKSVCNGLFVLCFSIIDVVDYTAGVADCIAVVVDYAADVAD